MSIYADKNSLTIIYVSTDKKYANNLRSSELINDKDTAIKKLALTRQTLVLAPTHRISARTAHILIITEDFIGEDV